MSSVSESPKVSMPTPTLAAQSYVKTQRGGWRGDLLARLTTQNRSGPQAPTTKRSEVRGSLGHLVDAILGQKGWRVP